MIEVVVPGVGKYIFKYLVCDYNGTLAVDGSLITGVADLLIKLSKKLEIFIVTADTFGVAKDHLEGLPVKLSVLNNKNQDILKNKFIENLSFNNVVAVGNGRNDLLMLKNAKLGIAIIEKEGINVNSFLNSDIICKSPIDALELLLNTKRLIATLRK